MFITRIDFDWPYSMDGIQMFDSPEPSTVLGSKRPLEAHKEGKKPDAKTIARREMMTLLAMNSALEHYKFSIITELKLKKNDDRSTVIKHEFVLMDVLLDPDARDLLLFMVRNESFGELCNANGISMNGRSRGASTRIVMDITKFLRFKTNVMESIFDSFKKKDETNKSAKLSNKKEPVGDKKKERDMLKFHWKKKDKEYQDIILNQYELKEQNDINTKALQDELIEEKENNAMLAAALSREQKKVLDTERRVAGQKGAGTRCLYIFFLMR
jgi:hypothetical protein